jgi:hypothetical protein
MCGIDVRACKATIYGLHVQPCGREASATSIVPNSPGTISSWIIGMYHCIMEYCRLVEANCSINSRNNVHLESRELYHYHGTFGTLPRYVPTCNYSIISRDIGTLRAHEIYSLSSHAIYFRQELNSSFLPSYHHASSRHQQQHQTKPKVQQQNHHHQTEQKGQQQT